VVYLIFPVCKVVVPLVIEIKENKKLTNIKIKKS